MVRTWSLFTKFCIVWFKFPSPQKNIVLLKIWQQQHCGTVANSSKVKRLQNRLGEYDCLPDTKLVKEVAKKVPKLMDRPLWPYHPHPLVLNSHKNLFFSLPKVFLKWFFSLMDRPLPRPPPLMTWPLVVTFLAASLRKS